MVGQYLEGFIDKKSLQKEENKRHTEKWHDRVIQYKFVFKFYVLSPKHTPLLQSQIQFLASAESYTRPLGHLYQ